MSETSQPQAAPQTGHPAVDTATAAVAGVGSLPPAEQLGRLTEAHEALHRALALDEPAG